MIKSMTGYGSAKQSAAGFDISVELKSVNNRYLETGVRIPRSCLFAEDPVKKAVQSRISRGKVDVFVTLDVAANSDVEVTVNAPLLRGYMKAIGLIAQEGGLSQDLSALSLAKFPDVLSVSRQDIDSEELSAAILRVLAVALDDFDAMRAREGEKLKEDVLGRLDTIETLVGSIEAAAPQTVEAYRARLEEKMSDILNSSGFDRNRIIEEAAIFADHIAVDEETVRLRSHMAQMRQMLETGSPIGKKMDFLIQEFNREANTIGSKCQNSDIAHTVVDLKSEIEKIREQIQNIE